MDLPLYLRVLWRYRIVVGAGIGAAIILAFFSYVSIGSGGFTHREKEQWVSRATVFVTQQGFPAGRLGLVEPSADQPAGKTAAPSGPAFVDPTRFQALAILYAELAKTDAVTKLIVQSGPLNGTVDAAAVTLPQGNEALPMVLVAGLADSPDKAERLAGRAANGLMTYIAERQAQSGTPTSQRVRLELVRKPTRAELVNGRSLTRPIVIFLAIALASMVLAFVLENLRRQPTAAAVNAAPVPPPPALDPAADWPPISVEEALAGAGSAVNGKPEETVSGVADTGSGPAHPR